jgi:LPXTG-site transpeptidase (sortase) family protein
MWKFIRNSKDWILIILGIILITFAVFNLFDFNPFTYLEEQQRTPVVEQEGFAPLFVPITSTTASETTDSVSQKGYIPERIVAEKIGLDAPIIISPAINVTVDGQEVTQFLVPEEFAAGWQEGSAPLGVIGNTVLSGHHNAFGKVFEHLIDLEVGDEIILLSGTHEFYYVIVNKMILPEKDEQLDRRLENARWILRSDDERLTLVTCWPANSNSHRLILVAVPEERPAATPTPTQEPATSIQVGRPVTELLFSGIMTPTIENQDFFVRNAGRFSINVREQPDMEADILGSFKAGHEATGLGRTEDGDWILIEYQDLQGWVSAELVQIMLPVDSLPTIATATPTP